MVEQHRIIIDRDVPAKMRDGVTLRADIFRPEGEEQHPVLLMRTPYDKSQASYSHFPIRPTTAITAGYVCVIQDVRGRFSSEGRFNPLMQEAADGYDTIEWCATQPWSNGRIGTYGISYVGAFQWLAAKEKPPHLKAMVPGVTASNFHEGWTHQGGAFQLGFAMSWSLNSMAPPNLIREEPDYDLSKIHAAVDRMHDYSFPYLPLKDYPDLKAGAPYYYEWLAHPDEDEHWDKIDIEKYHDVIAVPALNIGGWYDIFLNGTLANYTRMKSQSPTEEGRRQKLIVGPWSHLARAFPYMGGLHGDVDFGTAAAWHIMDMESTMLRWFDYWLRDEDNGMMDESPVKIFVMGENKWRDEKEWPLSRARLVDYYMHSGGKANSRGGDGAISTSRPMDEPADNFEYDPHNPVPTVGGNLCCDATNMPSGPYDQRSVEDRKDVLVYTTPPLAEEVEVTGPITLALWASTSALDTDFTGKLVDVHPSGYAQNLADGIIRARYRDSRRKASLLEAEKAYEYSVDLMATSNLFMEGHRIRVDISSSNFPRFDRNPNTGTTISEEAKMVRAVQHVYHDADRPSRIVLPIVPR